MSAIDKVLAERGSRYGEFVDHAAITQGIKLAMATGKNWGILDADMKECLEMMAHKTGRILNGEPGYIDSWTDIIGYARLVEKRLIQEQTVARSFMENVVSINPEALIVTGRTDSPHAPHPDDRKFTEREVQEAVKKIAADKAKAEAEEECDCPACSLVKIFGRRGYA